jgi:hypothetical protein
MRQAMNLLLLADVKLAVSDAELLLDVLALRDEAVRPLNAPDLVEEQGQRQHRREDGREANQLTARRRRRARVRDERVPVDEEHAHERGQGQQTEQLHAELVDRVIAPADLLVCRQRRRLHGVGAR